MVQEDALAILFALSLAGCAAPSASESSESAPIVGAVVPVGPSEARALPPTTETVRNCGGGNGAIVKHPSMTVLTSHSIEWEIGGKVGVGVTIGDGVVPGGVDLSGAFDSHMTSGRESGIEQSTAWDLPAQPNTIMEYTLSWQEIWQPGIVEVGLPGQTAIRVSVRYRTGIQSDIIAQRQLSCAGIQGPPPTSAPESTDSPLAPSTPTTTQIQAKTSSQQPLADGDTAFGDGLSLRATVLCVVCGGDPTWDPLVSVQLVLTNTSSQMFIIPRFGGDASYVLLDTGERLYVWTSIGWCDRDSYIESQPVNPGESIRWEWGYKLKNERCGGSGRMLPLPDTTRSLSVVFPPIGDRFIGATWQIEVPR